MSDESSSSDESVQEARKKATAKWISRLLSSKGSASSGEIGDYKTTEFSTTSLSGKRRIDSNKQVTVNRTVADQSAGGQATEKKNKSPSQPKASCGQCKKSIYDEQPMRFDSKLYHRFCFRCSSCNAQLDNASNTAYLCEAEQRFYCIRCCDCKCWLTNASKSDKESADKAADKESLQKADHVQANDQLKTGSNENKLISSKSIAAERRALSPLPDQLPERINERVKPTQSTAACTSKKCKFCNQILPDYLPDSQRSEPFEPVAIINQQPTAAQTTEQATGQSVAQTDAKPNYELNYKTQINKPKLDSRRSGEQVDGWPAGKLNAAVARRSPNRTQQEKQRIRLVKRPTVGPRIARIIDKLENSLNLKTQAERNFQESFFRDAEQNGREGSLAGEKVENAVGRLNLQENLNGPQKEQRKLSEQTGSPADQPLVRSLEKDLEQTLENKLEQKQDLHPVQSPSDRRPALIEHNEPLGGKANHRPSIRQSIACPNCKKVLPTSLFERGSCRPFCTVHCPNEPPTKKQADVQQEAVRLEEEESPRQTVSAQKMVKNLSDRLGSKSDLRSIRSLDEHYSRLPYGLPAVRGSPVANRLESERRPIRESPAEDAEQLAKQSARQPARQPVKQSLPGDLHLADRQSTTGICCKCGLKVRFNEHANPPLPSKCLCCSTCGGPLSPGRHSPNGEPNAPGRLQRADSYAFNVKHT